MTDHEPTTYAENQVCLLSEAQLRLIQVAHERAVAAHRLLIQGVLSRDWPRVERMAAAVADAHAALTRAMGGAA
ncbi:MAG TPA: hypothetical protein PLQ87_05345 [Phycisphaerae bacterium]|nr:hypothetical protein [Phycisphaerae bacterium]